MAIITITEYIETRSSYDPTDPQIVKLIEQAKKEVGDFCNCESTYNKAVALLVLHWKVLADQAATTGSSVVGALKSEKEGELSRTYGVLGEKFLKDAYLSLTPYGIEFQSLGNKCIFKPMTRLS